MKMKKEVLILPCILFLFSDVLCKRARILRGDVANVAEFPYIVSVRFYPTNVHLCAGVIVSEEHVLTVAHCLYDFRTDWSNIRVIAGSSTLSDKEGTAYSISNITCHPDYNAFLIGMDRYRNDLAIIKLKDRIEFNDLRNKAVLPTSDILVKSDAQICGWGQTIYPKGPFSYQLRKTAVKVMRYKDCKIEFPFPLLHDQFCTFRKSFSAGEGDYGGPVVSNGILLGIMTYKIPWFSDAPDIQINVFRHKNFIESALCS